MNTGGNFGEEFLISLPDVGLNDAREVSERIRNALMEKTGITVSMGVASYSRETRKEELISKADEALYLAKQKGRNRVEVSI